MSKNYKKNEINLMNKKKKIKLNKWLEKLYP